MNIPFNLAFKCWLSFKLNCQYLPLFAFIKTFQIHFYVQLIDEVCMISTGTVCWVEAVYIDPGERRTRPSYWDCQHRHTAQCHFHEAGPQYEYCRDGRTAEERTPVTQSSAPTGPAARHGHWRHWLVISLSVHLIISCPRPSQEWGNKKLDKQQKEIDRQQLMKSERLWNLRDHEIKHIYHVVWKESVILRFDFDIL